MKKECVKLNEVMEVLGVKKESEILKVVKENISNGNFSKSKGIKVLFDSGYEVKEISKELNIIYNMCYNVISNYMLVNGIEVIKEKKESKKDKVIEMLKEGKNNMEICKELKMNYNYVLKIKKEYSNNK